MRNQDLIAKLEQPTYPADVQSYRDFQLLAERLDLISKATAQLLRAAVPTPAKRKR